MASKEYAGVGLTESLAWLHSLVSFNTVTAGADCKFLEYGVNCEGAGGYDLAWMETRCPGDYPGSLPMAGHGVEIDWVRALWNVRTGGTSLVSMSGIASWVNLGAGSYTRTNPYDVLDAQANNLGGRSMSTGTRRR